MTAEFVIDAYHRLFQIERSFRMSKHDLRARPIYHHQRESIEAHPCAGGRPAPWFRRSGTAKQGEPVPGSRPGLVESPDNDGTYRHYPGQAFSRRGSVSGEDAALAGIFVEGVRRCPPGLVRVRGCSLG